jgi:hypothetical protein
LISDHRPKECNPDRNPEGPLSITYKQQEQAMSLFKKKDEHAGSGVDKPDPKGLVEKVVDKVKEATQAQPVVPPASPSKGSAAP